MEFIWGGDIFQNFLMNLCEGRVILWGGGGGWEYCFENSMPPESQLVCPSTKAVTVILCNEAAASHHH